jgi:signal transduction histidine kinase
MSGPTPVVPATPAGATGPLMTELSARRLGPVRRYFAQNPRVMDRVVMGLFAVPAVIETFVVAADPATAGQRGGIAGASLVVGLVLVGLGTLALYWRRYHPVQVTAALTVLNVLAMGLAGTALETGVAFGVYATAASRSQRTTWITVAVTTVTCGGVALLVGVESAVLFLSLLAVAIGTSVRNRRLHVADLVERTNALARDRDQHALLARAAERTRIAREMHDVVAHNLAVMIALADGAGAALDPSPTRARVALGEVSETGRAALADMRRVLGVLHEPDAPFEPQPGSTDLSTLVERFRTAGLDIRATGLGTDLPPDAGLQLAVYRIVSEALTNTLRHAPGTGGVDLVLRRTPTAVEIEVRDKGPAVPGTPPTAGGQGLIGMAERAAVYGGTVQAGPTATGWRVLAVLPWTGAAPS